MRALFPELCLAALSFYGDEVVDEDDEVDGDEVEEDDEVDGGEVAPVRLDWSVPPPAPGRFP